MELPQVGALIAARRAKLKLSLRAAAKPGGIGPSTWADVEAGAHPPSLTTQRAVALAFEWPSDWLDQLMAGVSVDALDLDTDSPVKRPVDVEMVLQMVTEIRSLRAAVRSLQERILVLEQSPDFPGRRPRAGAKTAPSEAAPTPH